MGLKRRKIQELLANVFPKEVKSSEGSAAGAQRRMTKQGPESATRETKLMEVILVI